ncbi:nitrogen fixation protein NifQ [Caballeronia sp. Lep1P3]|uniref:nitrogen fixation protein NifQ n=1 Tax=Caballeronia sp. Lep1P3 TaxID=2878150 RepID=UPI001FD4422D|nr:nitrogen fixation protein NifQ [Caballeronia sp. Lep1P3]
MNATAHALLARAAHPVSADSRLFARLVGARIDMDDVSLLGLDAPALEALIARHFPGARDSVRTMRTRVALRESPHWAFVRDLRALLLRHDPTKDARPDDAQCLATIIAAACLRPDHLWRDLGLDSRDDVTAMLERHYPELVARNTAQMRWKKFLAYELARANGVAPECAPGCPGCEDFAHCYAPR